MKLLWRAARRSKSREEKVAMERAHKKGNGKGEVEGKEEDRRVVSVVKAGRCSRGCAVPVTRRRSQADISAVVVPE